MEENIHRIHLTEESVISALYQSRDDFYRFGKHIHPAFEIYHFLSGECRMEIGSRVIQCRGGDFIMIMQNTVHSFFMEQKEPCCFYHIHFLPSLFEKLFLKNQEGYDSDLVTALVFKNNWYYKTAANEKLAALTAAIVERYAQDTPFSRAFVNAHLLELLLHVLELSGYEHTISTNGGGKSQYVQFALNYIHRNYTAKILIDDIAEALNISSRYLSKIFFQQMNITILNYINTYRINRSIDLMVSTELSLTEISSRIGLKDSQHFSRLFYNVIGITPNKYRKLLKKGTDT